MDYQSISQYQGKQVKITLINNFWYRARILSVSEKAIEFVEERGKHLSVTPEAILIIEEVKNGKGS